MSTARDDKTAEALLARVAAARVQLAEAAATADLSGVARALDELEEAHRVARVSGIMVPTLGGEQSEAEPHGETR